MKTILTALLAALAMACPASERTDNEALMRQCERGAVAQAAQRPDVVMLRQRLRATTDPRERDLIVQRLEAIHLAAIQAGRRAGGKLRKIATGSVEGRPTVTYEVL